MDRALRMLRPSINCLRPGQRTITGQIMFVACRRTHNNRSQVLHRRLWVERKFAFWPALVNSRNLAWPSRDRVRAAVVIAICAVLFVYCVFYFYFLARVNFFVFCRVGNSAHPGVGQKPDPCWHFPSLRHGCPQDTMWEVYREILHFFIFLQMLWVQTAVCARQRTFQSWARHVVVMVTTLATAARAPPVAMATDWRSISGLVDCSSVTLVSVGADNQCLMSSPNPSRHLVRNSAGSDGIAHWHLSFPAIGAGLQEQDMQHRHHRAFKIKPPPHMGVISRCLFFLLPPFLLPWAGQVSARENEVLCES